MVMPLGPDFAPALGINTNQLGWVGGSYTAAAAVAGIIGSLFIDKLDRKLALIGAVSGLMIATAFGGLAWDFKSLLLSRILAGMCGGPATSIAFSIVADTTEPERRGQAMGKVMGAFSLASVFGVPFGLQMAQLHDWTTPFFTTAAMGAVIIAMAFKMMPSMRAHLAVKRTAVSLQHLFSMLVRPINLLTYCYVIFAMLASFMIIPNISAYVQYNLNYPRANLGLLYAVGGIVSFITMRITGRMIDRFNASTTSLISTFTFVFVLWVAFIHPLTMLSPLFFFMLFMLAMGMRNVSSTTLATKIPSPQERAGFMSLFSCIQSASMAAGAFLSTDLLTTNTDKSLNGMNHLAMYSAVLSFFVPAIMRLVEKRLLKPH